MTGPCWRSRTIVAWTTFLKAISLTEETRQPRSRSNPMLWGSRDERQVSNESKDVDDDANAPDDEVDERGRLTRDRLTRLA